MGGASKPHQPLAGLPRLVTPALLLLLLPRYALAAGSTPFWSQAGGNPQGTSASFTNGPSQGNLKWSALSGTVIPGYENMTRVNSGVRGVVVGVDYNVFFGAVDGTVHAVDGTTGAVRWTYKTNGMILQSLALGVASPFSGYGVYAASIKSDYTTGTLYCLDSNNGSLIWSYTNSNIGQSSSPVVSIAPGNARVYVPGAKLYAFGLWGDYQWTNTQCSWPPSPAVSKNGESLYLSCQDDNKLYQLIAATGVANNSVANQPQSVYKPTVRNDGSVVMMQSNTAYYISAFNPTATALLWTHQVSCNPGTQLTVDNSGNIYFPCLDSDWTTSLLTLSADGNTLRTLTPTLPGQFSPPSLGANGVLYSVLRTPYNSSAPSVLFAVDSTNGNTLFTFNTTSAGQEADSNTFFSPAISMDGTVFVTTEGTCKQAGVAIR